MLAGGCIFYLIRLWNNDNIGFMSRAFNAPDSAKIHKAIDIPLDYECGPAMKRLNERQRAFVTYMLDFGGRNNTRAALAAGYGGTSDSVRVHAHRLAHDPNIQAAIKEEGEKRLNSSSIMAVNILLDIADDPGTENKDKLKAVEMILNRTGLHAKTEHKVAVTHTDETSAEMIKRIEVMASGLGIDPKKLLGNAVVEGEFEILDELAIETEDDLSDIFGEG